MPRELELKFTTDSPLPTAGELQAALEPLGLSTAEARKLYVKDRYFDDARASLSRAGLALRRRMQDGQMLATLKSRGNVQGARHEREEIELPLPDRGWPQQIEDRVSLVTDVSALKPYVVIDNERTLFPVFNAQLEAICDLSFDLVRAGFQQGSTRVEFLEIEIEAAPGVQAETLEEVATALEGLLKLAPSPFTKLERAQALLLGSGL